MTYGLSNHLTLLIVEDSEDDGELLIREIKRGGYRVTYERVELPGDLTAKLGERTWDMVITDFRMPKFSGIAALEITKRLSPDTPVIIVSGDIGEDVAVAAMKAGAHDYIIKNNLARLLPAIERELRDAAVRREHRQAEAALRESEVRYRRLVENLPLGIALIQEEKFVFCNNAFAAILGAENPGQIIGRTLLDHIHPDEHALTRRRIAVLELTKNPLPTIERRMRRIDGNIIECEVRATPAVFAGKPAVQAMILDITERKKAERQQTMEYAVTRLLAESMSMADVMPKIIRTICETFDWDCGALRSWDAKAQLLGCEVTWGIGSDEVQAFLKVTQCTATWAHPAFLGAVVANREPIWVTNFLDHPEFRRHDAALAAGLAGALAFPIMARGELLGVVEFFTRNTRDPDNSLIAVAQSLGSQIGQFWQRKLAEEDLVRMATQDSLTGLPNRSVVVNDLGRAITHADRYQRTLALLFIDLDRFKLINDTLGHDAGDLMLIEVGKRLRECLPQTDTVARLGGDEFVVLVENLDAPADVAHVAQKILDEISKPFMLGSREFHVTASIGISTYPEDSSDMKTLLSHADIAMYRAKEQGKNNFQFHSAQMNVHLFQHLAMEASLRRALERNEFHVHYQAKVGIDSGRITGAEALLRWENPDTGNVSLEQFIPLAEETGLIVQIGLWVLRQACEAARDWQQPGRPPLRVAVNLSARQFLHEMLINEIAQVLHETGLNPSLLELEITESMVMHNPDQTILVLQSLKKMGVHVSIDDFGTGYSSLAYLKRFPIDSIKVDRSFIQDIPQNADDAAIARAIIAMALSLRLNVIAEGVETPEQVAFLHEHHCHEMQGYYFSEPLSKEDFSALLAAHFDQALPPAKALPRVSAA